uniref:Putative secreted protein n=1 Tax=Ixodes ricinus TaxID=34613 RepID=A0A090XB07_IXORI
MSTVLAVLCVVSVNVLIFTEADSRTRNRPTVCTLLPKKPSREIYFGYEIYYFDTKERICKCFRSTQGSKALGGNAFHGHKACRNRCGGSSFRVCPRRGGNG